MRGGALLLQNPTGSGVLVQNHIRRPAKLLAYETAWIDADGVEHPVDPPVLKGELDVPSTGQLEFLEALLDVVTGEAPWAPVDSQPLQLSVKDGASKSVYRLVILDPSTSGIQWHIWEDETFFPFHDDWNEAILETSFDLFFGELLMPLLEVYGLGNMAKIDAAKLRSMRERVRSIHDTHMQQLGIYLTQGQAGYANALRLLMQELIQNRTYRLDMLGVVRDALEESDRNKAAIDAMEKRLAGRASASAIGAAVQTVLVGGDVAKIMYDLTGVTSTVDWRTVVSPALFALTPSRAIVTQNSSSVRFTVLPKGEAEGDFVYRWRTSGNYGKITDLIQGEKDEIVTTSREMWYFHGRPLDIDENDVDTISVEVFAVEPGQSTIPPGTEPIARMTAVVEGDDRLIDSRLEVVYGTTDLFATPRPCAEMYLRFPIQAGKTQYDVVIKGVGGQEHWANPNQDFKYRGSNHNMFIDLEATFIPPNMEEGYTPDWHGVCRWMQGEWPALPPYTLTARVDRTNDEVVITLFAMEEHPYGSNPPVIATWVPHWFDFVQQATFEVSAR